jgi:hypothetical protein
MLQVFLIFISNLTQDIRLLTIIALLSTSEDTKSNQISYHFKIKIKIETTPIDFNNEQKTLSKLSFRMCYVDYL